MPAEVAEILRPHARPSLPDWMEGHYTLPARSEALPGQWKRDYVPYLLEPMVWFTDEFSEQITLQACTQGGKTIFLNGTMGYVVDCDPGPGMLVMPTKETLERRLAGRLKPMFEANDSLLRHLGGKIENFNIGKETVLDNMMLYIGWAGSPVVLSDVSLRYIWIDEAALHAIDTGDVDYLTLIKRRTRGFRGRWKEVVTSSPKKKGSRFDLEYEAGDRCQWWPKCVHCGKHHRNSFEHIKIDRDKDGKFLDPEAYKDGRHARYCCPTCGATWTEYQRWRSMAAGQWCPEEGWIDDDGMICMPDGYRGEHVPPRKHHSVRIPSWLLHPVVTTIGDVVAGFVAAQNAVKAGDTTLLEDWRNNEAAETWEARRHEPTLEPLRDHIDQSYRDGFVPPGVQAVVLTIDVMGDYFWYAAIGYGHMFEAWLLQESRIESGDTEQAEAYQHLDGLIERDWVTAGPNPLYFPASLVVIDAGYHTDAVIDWVRGRRAGGFDRLWPVAGSRHVTGSTYRRHKVDEQLIRYDLNVNRLKDRLFRQLFKTVRPGPGYYHLPGDITDDVLAHLVAEHSIDDPKSQNGGTIWVPKAKHLPNHVWDLLVYGAVAAEIVGVGELGEYVPPAPAPARAPGGDDLTAGLPRFPGAG